MRRLRMPLPACLAALALASAPALAAGESAFAYKTSYRNVRADPDGIWTGSDLSPGSGGVVTIHEYELRTPQGTWLVSQIWNADCASATCPTRLLQLGADGRRTTRVDDMMHEVIPPGDARLTTVGPAAAFARAPFALSGDGTTLLNGDFSFPVAAGAKR